MLRRHLPGPPATVVDVGGGAGVHALWLSSLGYDVHLSDPVPLHVEQAKADARKAGPQSRIGRGGRCQGSRPERQLRGGGAVGSPLISEKP